VIAFGSQFIYTIKSRKIAGISIHRTIMDVVSLLLWTAYAARLEDVPLLIATSCELFTSVGILILVLIIKSREKKILALPTYSPDTTPERTPPEIRQIEVVTISERRNSI
jgi:hypothetical protein